MKQKPNTETAPAELTPQPWQAAKIAHWTLSRLKPYARNARTHSAAQVAKIAAYTNKRAILESSGAPFPDDA